MNEELMYAPLRSWLVRLAQGWRLSLGWRGVVAAPMDGHHGEYSVLLWREVA